MRSRSVFTDAAAGRAYGTVTRIRRRAPDRAVARTSPTAAPPITRRIRRDEMQTSLGPTCVVGVPTPGGPVCESLAHDAGGMVAAAQWFPNASAATRCNCRERFAVTHHSRVPASRAACGGSRRWRSRGASRQMRFPVPTATVQSTMQQLAVRRVRAHPGDATLTPGGDQRTGGGCVAIGAVRVEHQADAQLRAQPRGRAPTDTTGPPRRSQRRLCGRAPRNSRISTVPARPVRART